MNHEEISGVITNWSPTDRRWMDRPKMNWKNAIRVIEMIKIK